MATATQDLPFDQFSRQHVVARMIDVLRQPGQKLSIIDLGGHKGKTADFMPKDKITILDVFDENYPDYVKGDATNLTFADQTFDVACSFDVFEHIPRPRRLAFVSEALRVSRLGVFIAMPVDDALGKVSSAEGVMNNIHKTLYGTDHQWLKEHIDYKIPTRSELDDLLKKTGAHHISISSNPISDWQLLQTVIFVAARHNEATAPAQALNKWYNQNVGGVEKAAADGYRRIYFVSRDKQLVDSVKHFLDQPGSGSEAPGLSTTVRIDVLQQTLKSLSTIVSRLSDSIDVEREASRKAMASVNDLTQKLAAAEYGKKMTEQELANVYKSASWKVTKPLRSGASVARRAARRTKAVSTKRKTK